MGRADPNCLCAPCALIILRGLGWLDPEYTLCTVRVLECDRFLVVDQGVDGRIDCGLHRTILKVIIWVSVLVTRLYLVRREQSIIGVTKILTQIMTCNSYDANCVLR